MTQKKHEVKCSICRHEQRQEIEEAFVNWASPSKLAKRYRINRATLYRHADATDLMGRRQRNVKRALERIIEHADTVEPNAGEVVRAVATYAQLNGRGELIERRQTVNMRELFDRMSSAELDAYIKDCSLPAWFEATVSGTGIESKGDGSH